MNKGVFDLNRVILAVDESGKESIAGARPVFTILAISANDTGRIKSIIRLKKSTLRNYSSRSRYRWKFRRIVDRLYSKVKLVRIEEIDHSIIDNLRIQHPGFSLEDVSCCIIKSLVISFTNKVREDGYEPTLIYIDEPNWQRGHNILSNDYFEKELATQIDCPIKVLRNNDADYHLCVAAWIFARNRFLAEREKAGPLRSGHVGDFEALKYIRNVYEEERNLSRIPHQESAIPIRRLRKRFYHVLDFVWNIPSDFQELGKGFSVPYFVIRSKNHRLNKKLEYFRIQKDSYLNVEVEEKRCPGTWNLGHYIPCLAVEKNSFGYARASC